MRISDWSSDVCSSDLGLDTDLDTDSWDAVSHSHPQYGMKQLLTHMGAARDDVTLWPGCAASPSQSVRGRLLSEALRPAETPELWRTRLDALRPDVDAALSNLFICEVETLDRKSTSLKS